MRTSTLISDLTPLLADPALIKELMDHSDIDMREGSPKTIALLEGRERVDRVPEHVAMFSPDQVKDTAQWHGQSHKIVPILVPDLAFRPRKVYPSVTGRSEEQPIVLTRKMDQRLGFYLERSENNRNRKSVLIRTNGRYAGLGIGVRNTFVSGHSREASLEQYGFLDSQMTSGALKYTLGSNFLYSATQYCMTCPQQSLFDFFGHHLGMRRSMTIISEAIATDLKERLGHHHFRDYPIEDWNSFPFKEEKKQIEVGEKVVWSSADLMVRRKMEYWTQNTPFVEVRTKKASPKEEFQIQITVNGLPFRSTPISDASLFAQFLQYISQR